MICLWFARLVYSGIVVLTWDGVIILGGGLLLRWGFGVKGIIFGFLRLRIGTFMGVGVWLKAVILTLGNPGLKLGFSLISQVGLKGLFAWVGSIGSHMSSWSTRGSGLGFKLISQCKHSYVVATVKSSSTKKKNSGCLILLGWIWLSKVSEEDGWSKNEVAGFCRALLNNFGFLT